MDRGGARAPRGGGNYLRDLGTMEIMARKLFRAQALIGMDLEETGTVLSKLHEFVRHPIAKRPLMTASSMPWQIVSVAALLLFLADLSTRD